MTKTLDAVTLEVIRNALPAIANEMAADLQRTSYNMMIYEVRDFCTALVNPDGELVSQNVGGVSHFVADLGVIITDGIKRYGKDGFAPGDVIITNHQAVAGQHLNNIVIYMPYFYKGELLLFAMVRAHWIDVGGMSTGFGAGPSVADPWMEGLQLDQLKIYEAGKPNETLYRVLKDNIRFPESSLGDMKSQIAACRLAVRRLDELFEKYGSDTILDAIEQIFDETERKCRNVVGKAPRRRLRGELLHRRRRRQARRSGADPRQGHGRSRQHDDRPVGLLGRAQGGDQLAHLCRRARRLQGADRAARAGERRLVPRAQGHHPRRQHHDGALSRRRCRAGARSCRRWSTPSSRRSATPCPIACRPRITASSAAPSCSSACIPKTQRRFVVQSIEGGGWGGRPTEDGESGTVSVCQGDVRNGSIEGIELKCPVLVEEPRRCAPIPAAPASIAAASASTCACATSSRAAGISSIRGASNARPGAFGAASRARHGDFLLRLPGRERFPLDGRQPLSGAGRHRSDRAHRRRRRLGRSARARCRGGAHRRDRGIGVAPRRRGALRRRAQGRFDARRGRDRATAKCAKIGPGISPAMPKRRRREEVDEVGADDRRSGRDRSGDGFAPPRPPNSSASATPGASRSPFTPANVGKEVGIFAKHGLDIEITGFGGDAKLQQAMAADAVDVGLGSGPGMAFIVKGSPVKGIAAMAGPPLLFALVVRADGSVKTIADLKGRKVGISTVGSATSWLMNEVSRQQGWGLDGFEQVPIGENARASRRAEGRSGRRLRGRHRLGAQLRRARRRPHPDALRRRGEGFHHSRHLRHRQGDRQKPAALTAFLEGWFETIAFMRQNKAKIGRDRHGRDGHRPRRPQAASTTS